MKLKFTCDCGAERVFDSNRDSGETGNPNYFDNAIAEWKREHLRAHEKDGDHDDHAFAVDTVSPLR